MDRYIMKKNAMFAAGVSLFIGSLALAGEVWVTNDISPVNSSDFIWSSAAPTSADTWLVSGPDSLPDAVYNVDTSLEFAGLNISDVNSNTINILEGGSLALNSALTLADDSKLSLALSGGSMSVGGAFTYQSANPLSVSKGSSLNVTNEFKFNNSSAVFSGTPTSAEYSLNIGGNLNLRPTSVEQKTSLTFENGASAYVAGALYFGSNGNVYENCDISLNVLSGASVEVKGATQLYAVDENSSSKLLVEGKGSSLILNGVQITTRTDGTAFNESAVLEVANGAYLKTGSLELFARNDSSNVSSFIVRGGSSVNVSNIQLKPDHAGSSGTSGSIYFKVLGSNNDIVSTGSLYMNFNTDKGYLNSIEIDAGNYLQFANVEAL